MSILERANRLINTPRESVVADPVELVELFRLRGEKICSACPGVLSAKFDELKRIVESGNFNSMFMNDQKRKYTLPKGQSYRPFGSGEVYTNETLTDEIAEEIIRQNPAASKVFINDESVVLVQESEAEKVARLKREEEEERLREEARIEAEILAEEQAKKGK